MDDWYLADILEARAWHGARTIKVFLNITETGEIELFTDTVHVIKDVKAFAFTCSSDFVIYVQKEGRCFKALSLQTGATLSCVSGFSPMFSIPNLQAGLLLVPEVRKVSSFPVIFLHCRHSGTI